MECGLAIPTSETTKSLGANTFHQGEGMFCQPVSFALQVLPTTNMCHYGFWLDLGIQSLQFECVLGGAAPVNLVLTCSNMF